MKLLIMQFSSMSYHFNPLQYKDSPQHPVLKYLQVEFRLIPETKFITRAKLQAKLLFYIFCRLCFQTEIERTRAAELNGIEYYLNPVSS
jgi:hypothetical protein